MTVEEAIAAADAILPGTPAADDEEDPRWQAIIRVGNFIETEPEAVWAFIEQWGESSDADLRMAIAACLLEHLLERHFDDYFARVARMARRNGRFAETVTHCWVFGRSDRSERARRFERLRTALARRRRA